jgi:hypothetical protein
LKHAIEAPVIANIEKPPIGSLKVSDVTRQHDYMHLTIKTSNSFNVTRLRIACIKNGDSRQARSGSFMTVVSARFQEGSHDESVRRASHQIVPSLGGDQRVREAELRDTIAYAVSQEIPNARTNPILFSRIIPWALVRHPYASTRVIYGIEHFPKTTCDNHPCP